MDSEPTGSAYGGRGDETAASGGGLLARLRSLADDTDTSADSAPVVADLEGLEATVARTVQTAVESILPSIIASALPAALDAALHSAAGAGLLTGPEVDLSASDDRADSRAAGLSDRLSAVETSLATLTDRLSELPTTHEDGATAETLAAIHAELSELRGSLAPALTPDQLTGELERLHAALPDSGQQLTVEEIDVLRGDLANALEHVQETISGRTDEGFDRTQIALSELRDELAALITTESPAATGGQLTVEELDALRGDLATALEHVRETISGRTDEGFDRTQIALSELRDELAALITTESPAATGGQLTVEELDALRGDLATALEHVRETINDRTDEGFDQARIALSDLRAELTALITSEAPPPAGQLTVEEIDALRGDLATALEHVRETINERTDEGFDRTQVALSALRDELSALITTEAPAPAPVTFEGQITVEEIDALRGDLADALEYVRETINVRTDEGFDRTQLALSALRDELSALVATESPVVDAVALFTRRVDDLAESIESVPGLASQVRAVQAALLEVPRQMEEVRDTSTIDHETFIAAVGNLDNLREQLAVETAGLRADVTHAVEETLGRSSAELERVASDTETDLQRVSSDTETRLATVSAQLREEAAAAVAALEDARTALLADTDAIRGDILAAVEAALEQSRGDVLDVTEGARDAIVDFTANLRLDVAATVDEVRIESLATLEAVRSDTALAAAELRAEVLDAQALLHGQIEALTASATDSAREGVAGAIAEGHAALADRHAEASAALAARQADASAALDAHQQQVAAAREAINDVSDRVTAAGRLLVSYLADRDAALEEVRDAATVALLADLLDGMGRKDREKAKEQSRGMLARRRDTRQAQRYRETREGTPPTVPAGVGSEDDLTAILDGTRPLPTTSSRPLPTPASPPQPAATTTASGSPSAAPPSAPLTRTRREPTAASAPDSAGALAPAGRRNRRPGTDLPTDPPAAALRSQDLGSQDPGSQDRGSGHLGSRDLGSGDLGSGDLGSGDLGRDEPGAAEPLATGRASVDGRSTFGRPAADVDTRGLAAAADDDDPRTLTPARRAAKVPGRRPTTSPAKRGARVAQAPAKAAPRPRRTTTAAPETPPAPAPRTRTTTTTTATTVTKAAAKAAKKAPSPTARLRRASSAPGTPTKAATTRTATKAATTRTAAKATTTPGSTRRAAAGAELTNASTASTDAPTSTAARPTTHRRRRGID